MPVPITQPSDAERIVRGGLYPGGDGRWSRVSIDAGGQGYVFIEGLTIKWQLAGGAKGIEPPVALVVKDTQAAIRNCRFLPLGNTQRAPMAIRIEGHSWARVSDCRFEGFDYVVNYGPGTEGLVEDSLLRDGGHQGVTGYDRGARVERTIVSGSSTTASAARAALFTSKTLFS